MWNVVSQSGRYLLGNHCDYATAKLALEKYQERYPFGKLWPNGQGRYWFIFSLVEIKGDKQ